MPPDPPNGIITQYELQYRRVGGSYTSLQPLNTDLTHTVTGLTSGTRYEFRVRARTRVGYGSFSIIATDHTGELTYVYNFSRNIFYYSMFKFTSSSCPKK